MASGDEKAAIRQRKSPERQTIEKKKEVLEKKVDDDKVKVQTVARGWASLYAFAGILILSFVVRLWGIWSPKEVVFDEVHFGKFASYYLRREYYFDVHPPLAKMLLAIPGKLVGYDGTYLFDKIGQNYIENGAPYFLMRVFVAMFGATIPGVVYLIMAESGYSLIISTLTAFMAVFDNALVLHSRLVLLDSIMIFFMVWAVYFYIKFFKQRYQPFTTTWYGYMIATGVMMGCAISSKMVGLFTISSIGVAVLYDLWRLIDIRRNLKVEEFAKHFVARVGGFIVVPITIYLAIFYAHLAILTNSGPGDDYHTKEFQMQLKGSKMLDTYTPVYYGDAISFKHVGTKVFLNSRDSKYPQKYADGRVGSAGNQVTGHKEENDESYWIVLPAERNEDFDSYLEKRKNDENYKLTPEEMDKYALRNLYEVRLMHKKTQRVMRTHDVASPLTTTNMEFTTVEENDEKAFPDTIFILRIDRPKNENGVPDQLRTQNKSLRLTSKSQKVSMSTFNKKLPDWGSYDQEINGKKDIDGEGTLWTVNNVFGRKVEESPEARKAVPRMGFMTKFFELQTAMIDSNSKLTAPHIYQSYPGSWPLFKRGVSFWTKSEGKRQIYFVANVFGWYAIVASVVAFILIYITTAAFRYRRNTPITSYVTDRHLFRSGIFMEVLYLMHYIPFFLMGRALFIHHYLPSVVFGYMVMGAVLQFAVIRDYKRYALNDTFKASPETRYIPSDIKCRVLLGSVAVLQVLSFIYWSPFVYGCEMTKESIISRKWGSKWDFSFAK
ncbi:Dolichyl-phosphate-mannose-protein mannosyltransferase 4 [Zancudomyces culisetae]|uniref:Dolichyl-phosphate-mannose--protein mannosyltransferase n=1 Tax=Zancudomyces culisetae TaxID=1213189 RepID=A0A1R1PU37_ZANCU|nr:Dolichyl-phosphate-mannose-protein mannosyltransferase 4 [Zancudomyces culisetae]|eukprot:OMH84429.1 Dolichyl-phosphate-mannose-protein mannosyltransferase 4 [Zancudomyces culisetae]